MVSLEQPVRGSAAYEKNDQIRPAALLVKEFADAAKYKAQAGKVKAQAEQDKAQAEQDKAQTGQSSQDNIEIGVKKELAKEIKDIKCDSTVQVGKITSSCTKGSALARSRLLQVNNTECEGEMQQVSKHDGGKTIRWQNSSPQQQ